MTKEQAQNVLRDNNLRATPARIQVLQYFDTQKLPIGLHRLQKKFPAIDKVTLYRMIESFTKAGIVNKQDIGHDHADYELSSHGHHHHIYCESCGQVEDVELCELESLHATILKKSKQFSQINQHSLSFTGICKNCQ